MEYCTHVVEVEHFESEGMRQPMEALKCWYSSRKETAHKVSLAVRADLENRRSLGGFLVSETFGQGSSLPCVMAGKAGLFTTRLN